MLINLQNKFQIWWLQVAYGMVVTGFVSTFLLNPVRYNIVFDKAVNVPLTWIARGVFLNISRAVALLPASVILYYGFLERAFSLRGCYLWYSLLLYIEKIYS